MFESIGGLNVFQGGNSGTKKREERKDNRVRIEDVIEACVSHTSDLRVQ